MMLLQNARSILPVLQNTISQRSVHVTAALDKVQSGRYKITIKKNKPLTYEMAQPPHYIGVRKAWNSWNTSNIKDGNRPAETAMEDILIRKFTNGVWPGLLASEIIIKRQHNMIRICTLVIRAVYPQKLYFLTGFTEQMLSYLLQCPVKMEIVTVTDKKSVVFKYI